MCLVREPRRFRDNVRATQDDWNEFREHRNYYNRNLWLCNVAFEIFKKSKEKK
jgi:hypothetical protein